MIVVMSYDEPACKPLQLWLRGRQWEFSERDHRCDVARNATILRFLATGYPRSGSGDDSLVMLDSDTVPQDDSILTASGEVAWCGYLPHHVDTFGSGCCRISRSVLEKVGREWFRHCYDAEHTRSVMCQCQWFAERCLAIGVKPQRVGIVGHLKHQLLLP
ncbi:MAG: hypothetical protein ABSG86_07695 [Thermoguttaceae bacterium]